MARALFAVQEGISIVGTRAGGTDDASSVRIIKANVNPQVTAVDANTGSLLLNTSTGSAYIKADDGLSTNWGELSNDAENAFQNTYMGKTAGSAGNENPTYSSTNVVTQNTDLTNAISELDAEIGSAVTVTEVRTNNSISDQAVNSNISALDSAIGPDVTSTNYASTSNSINGNISVLDSQIKFNADAILAISSGMLWREPVEVVTSDADLQILANNTTALSTLLPFSDDDGANIVIGDFADGNYILSKNLSGTDTLWQVWDDAGTLRLRTTGFTALGAGNTFFVYTDLTDDAGQEGNSIFSYNGIDLVKVGDIDWQVATGIDISGGYSASAGTVTGSDNVESAIQKLDGNIGNLETVVGNSNATNMGTYTGSTITDNQSVKQNIQELETATETIQSLLAETLITGTITASNNANVDTINVSTENVMGVEWTIGCDDSVAVGRYMSRVVCLVNATGTAVDYNEYSILEVGTAPAITISSTASTGSVRLNIANGPGNTINYTVKRKILRSS